MGFSLPFRYNSPTFQVFLVGFICFCCPGMFNALTGMGGAGKSSTESVNNAQTALSVTFTVCSLLGAPIYNIFGHRVIIPAALCYVLYVGSFLTDSDAFTIATGAILGIGAGFLWTAQAGIMMSYPNESEKGKAFSIFWMIFNLGATIGAAIPLGNNWDNTTTSSVNIGTYIGLCKVVRSDGTQVSLHKFSNWKREAIEVLKLFMNWRMLILIPMFAGSNWFYTYQFQVYNGGGYFNLRARSLNNMLYWLFQIVGGGFFGWMLDLKALGGRRQRAIIGNTFVLVICVALWIGAIFIQKNFTYESAKLLPIPDKVDVYSPGYAGMAVEYAFFGFMDSVYQGFIYWLMGTMTNDTERAARYGGFYKTIQNAFAAVAAQLDAQHIPFMTQLIIVFVVNVVGILLAYVVCFTVPNVTVEEIDNLQGVEGAETVVGGRLEDEALPHKLDLNEKEFM
ncbi:major facilitator superfamily domain-containing protein [Absidia repens]|uniref:Major facilitator superfamily domain-containing protein n=1 Tax=Absidia repens TaxID=90262 RepID=A0A1X2IPR3_9FUNG|nr:major facilitator superfamily domain-containing protein [Absidia repens]